MPASNWRWWEVTSPRLHIHAMTISTKTQKGVMTLKEEHGSAHRTNEPMRTYEAYAILHVISSVKRSFFCWCY